MSHPAAYRAVERSAPRRSGFLPFVDVDDRDEQALRMPHETKEPKKFDLFAPEIPKAHPPVQPAPEIDFADKQVEPEETVQNLPEQPEPEQETAEPLVPNLSSARVIGSCFETYILAEDADGLILIDKHAAHERMLFNQLREKADIPTQMLLAPVVVDLSGEEYAAILDGMEQIQSLGFVMEPFGQHSVAVREAPAYLDAGDIPVTVSEMAQKLMDRRTPVPDRLDDLIHTVSCKAAIKAGSKTSMQEMQSLCDRVLSDPEVTCCPHGRPVTVRLTKYELDKMFKRVNQ